MDLHKLTLMFYFRQKSIFETLLQGVCTYWVVMGYNGILTVKVDSLDI